MLNIEFLNFKYLNNTCLNQNLHDFGIPRLNISVFYLSALNSQFSFYPANLLILKIKIQTVTTIWAFHRYL
jgi:hypothetical protein